MALYHFHMATEIDKCGDVLALYLPGFRLVRGELFLEIHKIKANLCDAFH